MKKLLLGVNIDHIATIRNARGTNYPDPIQAAYIAEQAGADVITVHLREDRRHIIDRDIHILRKTIQIPINLEIGVTDEMSKIACEIKPHFVCLVPENRQEITTEGGLDIVTQQNKIYSVVQKLQENGIIVSLFIDADYHQIEAAVDTGANYVEIHTGAYAEAFKRQECNNVELVRLHNAVNFASSLKLKVNAGHGLNYHNVYSIACLPKIHELNIGHAIISRALFSGLDIAIRDMKNIIQEARF